MNIRAKHPVEKHSPVQEDCVEQHAIMEEDILLNGLQVEVAFDKNQHQGNKETWNQEQ